MLLLAAGRSRRFGADNKLLADLGGKPLFLHAVNTISGMPFEKKIAAVSSQDEALTGPLLSAGFETVFNDSPKAGQGGSLALGARAAGKDANILVMLADMPFVPAAHIQTLLDAALPGNIVYSGYKGAFGPPALFCGAAARGLKSLNPKAGAKALRADFPSKTIPLAAKFARDIDTPQDLARHKR